MDEAAVSSPHSLSEAARAHLTSAGEPMVLAKGEVLFHQGAAADAAYLVTKGQLEIITRIPGDDIARVSEIGPGEIVGEAALLEDRPRSATVRALADTSLLRVPQLRFASLLADGWAPAAVLVDALCQLVARRIASGLARIVADDRFELSSLRQPGNCIAFAEPPNDLSPWLAGLPQLSTLVPHGAQLGALGRWWKAPRGALLATPGVMPDALYVVIRGALRSAFERPGGLEQLAIHGPGEVVGLSSLLTDVPDPLRIEAAEESLLLALGPASLAPLRTGRAPLGHALMRIAGHQLLRDQQRVNRHLGRAAVLVRNRGAC